MQSERTLASVCVDKLNYRNEHLHTMLIEAAKMAPRNSPDLAMMYDRETQKGNANRATQAVARPRDHAHLGEGVVRIVGCSDLQIG